jgi:glycosyltransferase involved in cell wall biosynthesis
MPTISVILITKNEEHNLPDCLSSLQGLADEIVVIDSGSSDKTVEIAKNFGAKVHISQSWPGFGLQKNAALELAQCDWVLSLDADERLTPQLIVEIRSAIKDPSGKQCFEIPRSSWYCGRFIRHSGWSPDYVARLFLRGKARFSEDLVHERLICNGPTGQLKEPMLHFSFLDYSQVIKKMDRYSTAAAIQAFSRGKRATFGSAIGNGLWAFLRTYILKAGFLDGAQGFALAISNAEGTYYRYLKIWQMGEAHKDLKP